MGYLRTMFHYVLRVVISQTHLLCAGNFFLGSFSLRKHIYLCIKESTVVPVSTQTHKNRAAEPTRRAVSIFCMYHVVLGSCLFFSLNA